MSYNTKNYSEQGGDKLVIGGELEIKEGAVVTGLESGDGVPSFPVAENQADSTAADVTELTADFNALISKLKAAGLMAED